jgi:hypothetical protein
MKHKTEIEDLEINKVFRFKKMWSEDGIGTLTIAQITNKTITIFLRDTKQIVRISKHTFNSKFIYL